jgi:hypothetical protein
MSRNDQLKRMISSLQALQSEAARRFGAEIEFAQGLAELEGKEKAWAKLIDRAWAMVEKSVSQECHAQVCPHPDGGAGMEGNMPARANSNNARLGMAPGNAEIDNAVLEAERILAPIGKAAKEYTIHCVGHAHIDMNWMWSWPETVHTTNDTFATMLKLMDEFPDCCGRSRAA